MKKADMTWPIRIWLSIVFAFLILDNVLSLALNRSTGGGRGQYQKIPSPHSYDVIDVATQQQLNGEYNPHAITGQTTRYLTTGEVGDDFWLKHLGEDYKNAIHLVVSSKNDYNADYKLTGDEAHLLQDEKNYASLKDNPVEYNQKQLPYTNEGTEHRISDNAYEENYSGTNLTDNQPTTTVSPVIAAVVEDIKTSENTDKTTETSNEPQVGNVKQPYERAYAKATADFEMAQKIFNINSYYANRLESEQNQREQSQNTQRADKEKIDTQNTNSHNKNEQNSYTQNTSSHNKTPQNTNSQDTKSQSTNTQNANEQNTNTQDTNTQDTNTQDTNTQDTNTQDTNTQDTNTQDTNTQDTNTQDTNTQNTFSEQTYTKYNQNVTEKDNTKTDNTNQEDQPQNHEKSSIKSDQNKPVIVNLSVPLKNVYQLQGNDRPVVLKMPPIIYHSSPTYMQQQDSNTQRYSAHLHRAMSGKMPLPYNSAHLPSYRTQHPYYLDNLYRSQLSNDYATLPIRKLGIYNSYPTNNKADTNRGLRYIIKKSSSSSQQSNEDQKVTDNVPGFTRVSRSNRELFEVGL